MNMDHLVSKTQVPSDIYNSPQNLRFIKKNIETEASMSSGSDEDPSAIKKSTLVEIPTPTARILYKTSGIFPFDLFPDDLVIDEVKISVVTHHLLSRTVNSVLIKDITDILLYTNPFFGSILITGGEYQGLEPTKKNPKGPLKIKFLPPNESRLARRVIMGLVIFSDEKIDSSKMTIDEILQKSQEFGKTKEII